jgi:hypothetical protein
LDWSNLQKPGKNGFLLIMISLAWWGSASAREGRWLEAVVDVTEVLLCIQKGSGGGSEIPKANPLGGPSVAAGSVTSKRGRRGDGTAAAAAGGRVKKSRVG